MKNSEFERFDNYFTRFDTIDEGVTIISKLLKCAKITIYTWRSKRKVPTRKFEILAKELKI